LAKSWVVDMSLPKVQRPSALCSVLEVDEVCTMSAIEYIDFASKKKGQFHFTRSIGNDPLGSFTRLGACYGLPRPLFFLARHNSSIDSIQRHSTSTRPRSCTCCRSLTHRKGCRVCRTCDDIIELREHTAAVVSFRVTFDISRS